MSTNEDARTIEYVRNQLLGNMTEHQANTYRDLPLPLLVQVFMSTTHDKVDGMEQNIARLEAKAQQSTHHASVSLAHE